jgi:hypothetical protein
MVDRYDSDEFGIAGKHIILWFVRICDEEAKEEKSVKAHSVLRFY